MNGVGILIWTLMGTVVTPDAATWAEKGSALIAAERWKKAVAIHQEWADAEPTNGAAWLGLGRSRLGAGEPDAAIESFAKAIANGANQGAFETARAYAAKGDRGKAVAWLSGVADAGAKIHRTVMAAREFKPFHDDPAFKAVLTRLKPCGGEHYRQFDFWLGEWDVRDVNNPASSGARNHITSAHDSCVLRESYVNGAYTGSSLSFYDAAAQAWHQTWIDNQGVSLDLNGGFENGSMILSSDPARSPINRITWTPNEDGTVRQLWETSADRGATWTVAFDGLYTRRE